MQGQVIAESGIPGSSGAGQVADLSRAEAIAEKNDEMYLKIHGDEPRPERIPTTWGERSIGLVISLLFLAGAVAIGATLIHKLPLVAILAAAVVFYVGFHLGEFAASWLGHRRIQRQKWHPLSS